MARAIVVRESIFVAAEPEVVFDFTQDYAKRPTWDNSVKRAEVLENEPVLKVRIFGSDGSRLIFEYKLRERPTRTTLNMDVEKSMFFEKGGGSWTYEKADGGTVWMQINSVQIRKNWLFKLFKPALKWAIERETRKSMAKAKNLIEACNL